MKRNEIIWFFVILIWIYSLLGAGILYMGDLYTALVFFMAGSGCCGVIIATFTLELCEKWNIT